MYFKLYKYFYNITIFVVISFHKKKSKMFFCYRLNIEQLHNSSSRTATKLAKSFLSRMLQCF